jgi:pyruvate dehydrogenase E2 component (dihydrolipoamide acetyltransferase)
MNILMPQLGETVAEGKITKWFKSAGDAVKPGDNLFEIETDKVSMEVPATEAGILSEIRVAEGEVAPVGAIVAVVGDGTGAVASASAKSAPAAAEAPKAPAPPAAPQASALPPRSPQQPIQLDPFLEVRTPERNFGPARLSGGVSVTPLARRLASDAKIDLSRLKGSGPHGRIVARDVESVPRPHPAPSQAALAEGPTADHVKALYNPAGYEEVPLDGMRKTIAARLQQAKRTIPHYLSDGRHHDRCSDRSARTGQRGRAERSRWQTPVQALAQRLRCNAFRRQTRPRRATAFCASNIQTSASPWRRTAD